MRPLLFVALLLLVPAAAALPLPSPPTGPYQGIAHQGSYDRGDNPVWSPGGACADVVTTFDYTLVLLEGTPLDQVTLLAFDVTTGTYASAVASVGAPAHLRVAQPDSCGRDFAVLGTLVLGFDPYTVAAVPVHEW